MSGYYDDVYDMVMCIPPGKVSTYGRIAALTPVPRGARGVGSVSYTHLTLPTIYSV